MSIKQYLDKQPAPPKRKHDQVLQERGSTHEDLEESLHTSKCQKRVVVLNSSSQEQDFPSLPQLLSKRDHETALSQRTQLDKATTPSFLSSDNVENADLLKMQQQERRLSEQEEEIRFLSQSWSSPAPLLPEPSITPQPPSTMSSFWTRSLLALGKENSDGVNNDTSSSAKESDEGEFIQNLHRQCFKAESPLNSQKGSLSAQFDADLDGLPSDTQVAFQLNNQSTLLNCDSSLAFTTSAREVLGLPRVPLSSLPQGLQDDNGFLGIPESDDYNFGNSDTERELALLLEKVEEEVNIP